VIRQLRFAQKSFIGWSMAPNISVEAFDRNDVGVTKAPHACAKTMGNTANELVGAIFGNVHLQTISLPRVQ
jgi:hypothetical protein